MKSSTYALGLSVAALCFAATAHAEAASPPVSVGEVAEVAEVAAQTQSHQGLSSACYAQSLLATGDPSSCDALIALSQSQTVAPARLAAAYSNRGLMVGRRATAPVDVESLQAALADHARATQLAPQRIEPLMNQANVLLTLGRVADAANLYTKIASLPGPAATRHRHIALHNRAIAYRAMGDLERAYVDLMEARRLAAPAATAPIDSLAPAITRQGNGAPPAGRPR